MSSATELRTPANLAAQVQLTRRAARELARLSAEERNEVLRAAADRIEAREAEILEANRLDCETLARDVTSGPASAALALAAVPTSAVLAWAAGSDRAAGSNRRAFFLPPDSVWRPPGG